MTTREIARGWLLPDGTREYRPDLLVTRDAMAAFLHRREGSPEVALPTTSPFVDVSPDDQFYREIVWLHSTGISTGWSTSAGQEFRPTEPLSRDAMAAFVHRYAVDVASPPLGDDGTQPAQLFTDVAPGDQFYREITRLGQLGITEGWDTPDGPEFRPRAGITRDAMAAFLFRLGR